MGKRGRNESGGEEQSRGTSPWVAEEPRQNDDRQCPDPPAQGLLSLLWSFSNPGPRALRTREGMPQTLIFAMTCLTWV